MINHARTLLVNVDGIASGFAGYPGEEYVPPLYRQMDLGSLDSVYRVLFGSGNPDRVFINYRVRQLLNLIHSTDLEEYLLTFDSRVTYDTTPLDEFFYDLFQVQAVPYPGTTAELSLVGDARPTVSTGQSFQQWSVSQTVDTITVIRQTSPREDNSYPANFTDGVSDIIPLAGSELQFRTGEEVGASWTVSGYSRPQRSIGDLEEDLRKIGEPLLVRLFRVTFPEGTQEPYTTFRNCWEHHKEQPYRMAGLLLAYIYQLEVLRNADV